MTKRIMVFWELSSLCMFSSIAHALLKNEREDIYTYMIYCYTYTYIYVHTYIICIYCEADTRGRRGEGSSGISWKFWKERERERERVKIPNSVESRPASIVPLLCVFQRQKTTDRQTDRQSEVAKLRLADQVCSSSFRLRFSATPWILASSHTPKTSIHPSVFLFFPLPLPLSSWKLSYPRRRETWDFLKFSRI